MKMNDPSHHPSGDILPQTKQIDDVWLIWIRSISYWPDTEPTGFSGSWMGGMLRGSIGFLTRSAENDIYC